MEVVAGSIPVAPTNCLDACDVRARTNFSKYFHWPKAQAANMIINA
jgi:hypothetical protein